MGESRKSLMWWIAVRATSYVTAWVAFFAAGSAFAQAVDPDFNPGANGTVYAMAVQADGKILVGGDFSAVGGGFGATTRNRIARLLPDGTVDASFNPGASSNVNAIVVQPDGKILIGGWFTTVGGGTGTATSRNHLARLNADGSIDSTFNPNANSLVNTIVLQPDGKILVGGSFSSIGGASRANIARLNADGTVDAGFNPGASGEVNVITLQADGRILVGGSFQNLGGGGLTLRRNIGRLLATGAIDASFDPGANGEVQAIVEQGDGKIVFGGSFSGAGGGTGQFVRNYLARVQSDGSIDLSYNPGATSQVSALLLRDDGRLLVGGFFSGLGEGTGTTSRDGLGLLNVDGTVAVGYDPGTSWVRALAMGDGRVLVGGQFSTLGGGSSTFNSNAPQRKNIGRLLSEIDLTLFSAVDHDGDHTGDLLVYRADTGFRSSQFTFNAGFVGVDGGWAPNWTLKGARFTDDGVTDAFLFNTSSGQWFTVAGDGVGGFTNRTSGFWSPTWQRFIVDLNGDGLSDVFLWNPATGAWFKCLTRRDGSFSYQSGFWFASAGWELYPMRLNADRRQDFFLFNRATGQWFWVVGAEDGFAYPASGFWSTEWTFQPADFNGDGLSDLLLQRPSDGLWIMMTVTGAASYTFTSGFFSTGFAPTVFDVEGDGRQDLFLHNATSGQWFELASNGAGGFTAVGTGFWTIGWRLFVTDFNNDARQDIFLYHPTMGWWFQARNLTAGSFSYTSGAWTDNLTVVANLNP